MRNFYRPDRPHHRLWDYLITKHLLTWHRWYFLFVDQDWYLFIISTDSFIFCLFVAGLIFGRLSIKAYFGSKGHFLEGKYFIVLLFTWNSLARFGIFAYPFLQFCPHLFVEDKGLQELENFFKEISLFLLIKVHFLTVGLKSHHLLLIYLNGDKVLGPMRLSYVAYGLYSSFTLTPCDH